MKFRADFVTNSSSSSFLICKKNLSDNQIKAINNHSELGKKLGLSYAEEEWSIDESDNFISGHTGMDNFQISELFDIIGVSNSVIWDPDTDAYEAENKLNNNEELFSDSEKEAWEELLDEIEN
ncbi:hypothetical protein [Lacrimispora amygdalina]|uniref:hypothetical protein n=1 Tax=Lacrimispora amygdalina TaxID=253257 RepID=UPI000BE3B050|nr:hypothetical protein [Lacrimispora amygdalina]